MSYMCCQSVQYMIRPCCHVLSPWRGKLGLQCLVFLVYWASFFYMAVSKRQKYKLLTKVENHRQRKGLSALGEKMWPL